MDHLNLQHFGRLSAQAPPLPLFDHTYQQETTNRTQNNNYNDNTV